MSAFEKIIDWAFRFWDTILGDITVILTTEPQSMFGGAVWETIVNINTAFQSVAYGLLALFFLMSFLKNAIDIREIKRIEVIIRYIIQLVISMAVITHGMDIVLGIFSFGMGLVSTVTSIGSLGGATTLPADIIDAANRTGFWEKSAVFIIALLGAIVIIAVSITILIQVYGRFFKIYLYAALAPIALAGFAGSETSFMGKSFIKNFAAVCLEGAVIMIACVIWQKVANTALPVMPDAGVLPSAMLLAYMVRVIISMVLLASVIKLADTITKSALGLH
jgi:hypothetical protein